MGVPDILGIYNTSNKQGSPTVKTEGAGRQSRTFVLPQLALLHSPPWWAGRAASSLTNFPSRGRARPLFLSPLLTCVLPGTVCLMKHVGFVHLDHWGVLVTLHEQVIMDSQLLPQGSVSPSFSSLSLWLHFTINPTLGKLSWCQDSRNSFSLHYSEW